MGKVPRVIYTVETVAATLRHDRDLLNNGGAVYASATGIIRGIAGDTRPPEARMDDIQTVLDALDLVLDEGDRPMTGEGGRRAYPLPRPDDDPRFSFGLLFDVARALEQHGYPRITDGGDVVELRQALSNFIYAQPEVPR